MVWKGGGCLRATGRVAGLKYCGGGHGVLAPGFCPLHPHREQMARKMSGRNLHIRCTE